jgi:hypothetical protein
MATQTPWGKADHVSKVTRGIIFYGTPSHGGYHVSKTLNARVDPAWRNALGWYEEDCDWAIVVLTFPEYFPSQTIEQAHYSGRNWHPDAYEKVMGVTLLPEESYLRRQATEVPIESRI